MLMKVFKREVTCILLWEMYTDNK